MTPKVDTAIAASGEPDHLALAAVFNQSFRATYNVRCIGGFEEPEYLTSGQTQGEAQLRYTRDYPASLLHEVAHWCVASSQRLALPDFGYHYLPPPRDKATQERFFQLEFKAQTLEAWFAMGCGVRFVASADNFECSSAARGAFAAKIAQRLQQLRLEDVPVRAQIFAKALAAAGLASWPTLYGAGIQGSEPLRLATQIKPGT